MANPTQTHIGDQVITGHLEVLGGINSTDIVSVKTATQTTEANVSELDRNKADWDGLKVPTTSLGAHISFDEGLGTVAADGSGNENPAGLSAAAWAEGISGYCLDCDGTDYADLESIISTTAISVSQWVKGVSGSTDQRFIDNYNNATSNSVSFGVDNSITYNLGVFLLDGTTGEWIDGGELIPDNNWHCVGFSFDNVTKTCKIYLDGLLIKTATYSGGTVDLTERVLRVGARKSDGTKNCAGQIDETIVYSRILTDDEFRALATVHVAGQPYGLVTGPKVAGDILEGKHVKAESWLRQENATPPIAYFSFDDEDTPNAQIGGSTHKTTKVGAPTFESGYLGNAVRLDGAADYLTVADHADFDFGTGAFSVGCWFNSDVTPNGGRILSRRTTTSDGWELYLSAGGNGYLSMRIHSTVVTQHAVSLSATTWYHVVFTRDGSNNCVLYLNGLAVDTGTAGNNIDVSSTLGIGVDIQGPANYFDGLIDEVWVFDRELTAGEVKALYTNQFAFHSYMIDVDQLKAGSVAASKLIVGSPDNIFENGDPIGTDDEIFFTDFTASSSDGRKPVLKDVVFLPKAHKDEGGTEYDSLLAPTWDLIEGDPYTDCIGFFEEYYNLQPSSEDLTDTDEWTPTACTVALTDLMFDNKRFSKVTCSGTSTAYVEGSDLELDSTDVEVHVILKKGNQGSGEASRVTLRDTTAGTNRLIINVTWSTSGVSVSTGSKHQVLWHGTDEYVEIWAKATGINTGNTNVMRFYPNTTEAANEYGYCTAMMAVDMKHPVPYVPTKSISSRLKFSYNWGQVGSVETWIYAQVNFNTTEHRQVFADYDADAPSGYTQNIYIRYNKTNNWFDAYIRGSSAGITLTAGHNGSAWGSANAFSDSDDLQLPIHLKFTWDVDNDNYYFYVNGVLIDSETSTDIGTFAANNTLCIGSRPGHATPDDHVWNGWIHEFMIHGTADTTLTHANSGTEGYPWVDEKTIANLTEGVAIDNNGIRLRDADVALLDPYNRIIEVGGSTGIRAKDAGGQVIHDIPDAPILLDMVYGGHVIWKDAADFVASVIDGETTASSSSVGTIAANNVDISAHIPPGLTNVKGIVVTMRVQLTIDWDKVQVGTIVSGYLYYGVEYNQTPGEYNAFGGFRYSAVVADTRIDITYFPNAVLPVVYDGGTPYVNWDVKRNFSGMVATTGDLSADAYMYIEGVLV